MRNILILEGGVNVTPYIKAHGYSWTRNTLHSDQTTRTKDGTARVVKITDKVTLAFELGETPAEKLTFRATYYGIEGEKTLEFYCASFTTGASIITDNHEIWESASFSMVEV